MTINEVIVMFLKSHCEETCNEIFVQNHFHEDVSLGEISRHKEKAVTSIILSGVSTTMKIPLVTFWDLIPYSLVERNHCFQ
jgi:hypothetical protein